MLSEKKYLIIIKKNRSLYVSNQNKIYSFPSFKIDEESELEKEIRKLFGNDVQPNDINISFWKIIEHISHKHDKRVSLHCYIIDLTNSNFSPRNYEEINIDEIEPKLFCDEQKKAYEFLRAIPDSDRIDNEQLFGQVYYEDGQINISLINKKLLIMELDSIERREAFPLYFYEFISSEIEYINEDLLRDYKFDGSLYTIKLLDEKEEKKDKLTFQENPDYLARVKGKIIFSASPILAWNGIKIVIKKITDPAMKTMYDNLEKTWKTVVYPKVVLDQGKIHKWLDDEYSIISPDEIKVQIFNVGQANCVFCDLQYRKLLFDIGVTYHEKFDDDPTSPIYRAVHTYISKIDVNDVFLSHWDLDHILGTAYNHNVLIEKHWIAPDFKILFEKQGEKVRISIINLVYYLIFVGCSEVMLIDTSVGKKDFFESYTLSVYLGDPIRTKKIINLKPKRKYKYTNKLNNGGIILKLQNKDNMLLPGDCDNEVFPKCALKTPYDNIIVSHHGSVMADPVVIGKKPNSNNNAYICVAKKGFQGNFLEDINIRKLYRNVDFRHIRRTRNLRKNCYYEVLL